MKTLFVALIVPCVWAILFALAAAVNADVLTWVPTHSVIDTVIVRPLAGITLMLLCLTIPRFLVRTAMIGPHAQPGRGRLWRTVTIGMLGSRAVSGGARAVAGAAAEGNPGAQRMIDALPSPARPPSEPGSGGLGGPNGVRAQRLHRRERQRERDRQIRVKEWSGVSGGLRGFRARARRAVIWPGCRC